VALRCSVIGLRRLPSCLGTSAGLGTHVTSRTIQFSRTEGGEPSGPEAILVASVSLLTLRFSASGGDILLPSHSPVKILFFSPSLF
jgi:hypothetical protein